MTNIKENKKSDKMFDFMKLVINCFLAMFVAFLFVTFVAQRTVVDGSSMEPTYHDSQNLIVNKLAYKIGDPKRFDVLVFEPNNTPDGTYYIKRVIGLPGETVKIDFFGTIYINGEELKESYGKEQILNPGIAAEEITLGEDEIFVLGDNRNNSADSRLEDIGPINMDQVTGKIFDISFIVNRVKAMNSTVGL